MERGWIETSVAGERIVLTSGRGVYWPARETLLVADLHLGKVDAFQAAGACVPAGVQAESLERLAALAAACKASRLVVLGDLLHAPAGITPSLRRGVTAWRRTLACDVRVLPGNHDRGLDTLLLDWGITPLEPGHQEGPFAFHHFPVEFADCFTWAGHVHPVVSLRSGADGVRLACYHIGPRVGVLPAFSRFTGGASIRPAPGERVYPIVEGRVIAM